MRLGWRTTSPLLERGKRNRGGGSRSACGPFSRLPLLFPRSQVLARTDVVPRCSGSLCHGSRSCERYCSAQSKEEGAVGAVPIAATEKCVIGVHMSASWAVNADTRPCWPRLGGTACAVPVYPLCVLYMPVNRQRHCVESDRQPRCTKQQF